jgi:hypothetical protein
MHQPTRQPCEMRALWAAKDGNSAAEWEDAFACDPEAGLAVLADGASQGIFSRLWARTLTRRYLIGRPDLDDPAAVSDWLAGCRVEWMSGIHYNDLHGLEQDKIDRIGAAATFLAFEVHRGGREVRWRVGAVGDTCFLCIRDGRLVVSFPLACSDDFGIAPDLTTTLPRLAPQIRFVTVEGTGKVGDLYGLATDAVAEFLLRCYELDEAPDWQRYWDMDQEGWQEEVRRLREQRRIVNDDSTLLMVRVRE